MKHLRSLGRLTTRSVIVSCLVLATACAHSPKYKWFKKGATAEQFSADKDVCAKHVNDELRAEGDFEAPIGRTPVAGQMLRKQKRAEELFMDCMHSAGYVRVSVEGSRK